MTFFSLSIADTAVETVDVGFVGAPGLVVVVALGRGSAAGSALLARFNLSAVMYLDGTTLPTGSLDYVR